jgi:ABC-type antimicrobial peptide transport system permease subunit
MVGRQGLVLMAIGIVLGVTATFPIGAALAKSIFGVSRIGWPVFAAVVTTLLLTGGLATLIPALRTARIDPLRALRQS